MSVSTSVASPLRENLAPRAPGVIRSAAMSPATVDTAAKIARARSRIYVIAQAGGWGAFLFMQMLFLSVFSGGGARQDQLSATAGIAMVAFSGLLLTKFWLGKMVLKILGTSKFGGGGGPGGK